MKLNRTDDIAREALQPDPMLKPRINWVWSSLAVVGCLVVLMMTIYAFSESEIKSTASAKTTASGGWPPSAVIPETRNRTTTPAGVAAPGDRATATIGGPSADNMPDRIEPEHLDIPGEQAGAKSR